MAFWGLEVKPGKQPAVLNLERRLVVKQAALVVAKPDPTPCVLSVRGGGACARDGSARARLARSGRSSGASSALVALTLSVPTLRNSLPLCRNSQRAARHTRSAARPPHSRALRTAPTAAPASPPQAAMVTPKQWKIAAALVVGLVVLRGFLDLGIPFMLMHLYYISPKSYLLSMGAAADGKKVVHIKYCVA